MHTNIIFNPNFPEGFNFPSKKPTFLRTILHSPPSGAAEIRSSTQLYPLWEITYSLNWARGAENMPESIYNYMLGFFIQAGGRLSDFLYFDVNDNSASKQFFGIGDGATKNFQLVRAINIGTDICQNLNGAPTIYGNNALISSSLYTVTQTGIVVFTTAPAPGTVLTWSGNFYYRVRFDTDALEFAQIMDKIWESKTIRLRSVILGSLLS